MHNGRQGCGRFPGRWLLHWFIPSRYTSPLVRHLPQGLLAAIAASAVFISGCAGRPHAIRQDAAELRTASAAVTWFAPELDADRVSLESWRRSVGPPVVSASSARVSSAQSRRLVIVNWNMHVGGGDIAGLFADVQRQWGPDTPIVFLIQEAYREGPEVPRRIDGRASFASLIRSLRPDGSREEVESAAQRLGLHAYYVPSMRNGGPDISAEDRGNAILSTVPLTEHSAIELPFERQRRVAVAATVAGTTPSGRPWRLRVVSAHLDNMVGARRLWIAGGEFGRTRQARGLVSALADQGPLVLGADLNSWFGFRDGAYRAASTAFPQTPVSDRRATFHGLLRLDHLFFRLNDGWTAQFARADATYGSDHYPLVGHIDFH
jgi:endonuclease/exonuclease/phosphatase family metal-dependent hydrolase